VHVALGGAFSLFLVRKPKPAAGDKPAEAAKAGAVEDGCILLVSGCLGIDITRDMYGYNTDTDRPEAINALLDEEMTSFELPKAGKFAPRPVKGLNFEPCVFGASAGARVAAVLAWRKPGGGGAGKATLVAMAAGKGWLGRSGGAQTVLLPQPELATTFEPVGGALAACASPPVELAVGHSHILARCANGELFSWGRGDSGELGHGSLSDRSMPHPVLRAPKAAGYSAVAAGSYYTVAVASDSAFAKPDAAAARERFAMKWDAVVKAQIEAHKPHAPVAHKGDDSSNSDAPPARRAAPAR